MKEPKDLGIKIEDESVAHWIRMKDGCEKEIDSLKKQIELNELMLPVLEKRIEKAREELVTDDKND